MTESRHRQLAAIMFTDMVGYTILMQTNEDAARAARIRHREVLEAAVASHHGRLLQYLGDGSMTIFPSAVDAAHAAIEIQLALKSGPSLPLRIGIHQGEIAFDDQGVYGDAVNVASRVQNLGSAAAVLITGKVFDEIKNQPALPATFLGEFRLKNLARPVRVYALATPGLIVPSTEPAAGTSQQSVEHLSVPHDSTSSRLVRRLNENLAPDYVIDSQLDAGGAALVFEARDVMLQRRVAIKVIRPELATVTGVERFLREARVLASLNHSNIVPVHRAGTAGGFPYYVMDLLAGETLDQRMQRGRLPRSQALAIGRGLLDGLGAAHKAGIIHGDLDPSNAFVSADRTLLAGFDTGAGDPLSVPGPPAPVPSSGGDYRSPEQRSGRLVTKRSDVYCAAMILYELLSGRRWLSATRPEAADWSGVPRRLVRALSRALDPDPERRWTDATQFRRALFVRWPSQARIGIIGPAALAAGAAGLYFTTWSPGDATTAPLADLALLPFEAVGARDSAFAANLTVTAARYLEDIPQLVMIPIETSQRWWDRSDVSLRGNAGMASRELGAEHVTRGRITPVGDSAHIELGLLDSLGHRYPRTIRFVADPSDLMAAGRELARRILREHFPLVTGEPVWRGSPSDDLEALLEFLNGERARHAGAWQRAVDHYSAALERDSMFADARWQRINVWRWMPGRTPPLGPELDRLAEAGPEDLTPLDRLLVEAQRASSGEQRLRKYADAIELNPRDAYATLLYGEELFHRGSLAGYPVDSSTFWLETAAALDPNLAPTYELLSWHYIRLGDHAAAKRAVQRLLVLVQAPIAPGEVPYARLLEHAYLERFDPAEALRLRPVLFGGSDEGARGRLEFAVRAGLAFELPQSQLALGEMAARQRAFGASGRANGHIAKALALAALGRGQAALAQFDSAVALESTNEYRLMAAQWRVIPNALGYVLFPEAEVQRGLESLTRLAEQPRTATRAAWTLALHAYATATPSAAQVWHDRLRARATDSIAARLAGILDAWQLAAAGQLAEALERSAPSLAYDAFHLHGDPFARTVLHLARGQWFAGLNQAEQARSDWLWTENTDIGPWFSGEPQAAEVDWVLSSYVSFLRGTSAIESDLREIGCAQLERALQFWREADSLLHGVRQRAAARHGSNCLA